MKIEEGNSYIIIREAPPEFLYIIKKLPWYLFWWETNISHTLLGELGIVHPTTLEDIMMEKPIDEAFDIQALSAGIEDNEEKLEANFTFYFFK